MSDELRRLKQHFDPRKKFPVEEYDAVVDIIEGLKAARDHLICFRDAVREALKGTDAEKTDDPEVIFKAIMELRQRKGE